MASCFCRSLASVTSRPTPVISVPSGSGVSVHAIQCGEPSWARTRFSKRAVCPDARIAASAAVTAGRSSGSTMSRYSPARISASLQPSRRVQ